MYIFQEIPTECVPCQVSVNTSDEFGHHHHISNFNSFEWLKINPKKKELLTFFERKFIETSDSIFFVNICLRSSSFSSTAMEITQLLVSLFIKNIYIVLTRKLFAYQYLSPSAILGKTVSLFLQLR